MKQTQVQVRAAGRKTEREDDLRAAHERAFDKIRRARGADRRRDINQAVEELIDACERYAAP